MYKVLEILTKTYYFRCFITAQINHVLLLLLFSNIKINFEFINIIKIPFPEIQYFQILL